MPSDPTRAAADAAARGARAERALDAMRPRIDAFRSAVATAREEVRSHLTPWRGSGSPRAERALVELGPFARGRIDPARFAALLDEPDDLAPGAEDRLAEAERALAETSGNEGLFRVVVPPGGDLRDVVRDALERAGRVFAAARMVERVRHGRSGPDGTPAGHAGLPFRRWNRAERQLAPPLVVEVEPDDLAVAGLGELLDGSVKIVLVTGGATAPAPLARLLTPGTWVAQTADVADVAALAASPHPGVLLLLDAERDGQARFVHDPDRGGAPSSRLEVRHLPEEPRVGRGRRPPAWLEELEHLRAFATPPRPAAAPDGAAEDVAAATPADPTDRLAAWLLTRVEGDGG